MLKSISVLSAFVAALVLMAGLSAEDPAKTSAGGTCSGGACAKAASKACAGCPAATATAEGESQTCTKDGIACAGQACATSACATSACAGAGGKDCKDCPITAAMAALPQITFVVGEEKTCCPKTAAELAQQANTSVHYMVCEKSYDAESDAKLALADVTEQFVAAYAEPKACKETGKVTVCGKELCCEATAAQTAAAAKAAMDKVAMIYLVGEKECHCPVEAAKLAKDSGEPTVFVVAGESTACNVTARLNLARAKYKAAVVATMQAEAPTPEKLTSQDS